jgi:CBS domain-containing protein
MPTVVLLLIWEEPMIFDTRVSEVLAFKGSRHVWMLPGSATLRDAIKLMREQSIGSVVIADDDEVVGVVSERECLAHLSPDGYLSQSVKLRDVAILDFPVVSPSTTARECFELMAAFRSRYIPVVESGQLAGLVSIGDIVRALVDDQRFTIEQLMAYVTGSYGHVANDWDLPSSTLEVSSSQVRLRTANQ